jgi:hypothetical protein
MEGFPDLYHDRRQVETAIGDVRDRLRGEQERPWIPGPGSHGMILLNPEGTCHLPFDTKQGAWFRLFENRPPQPLSISEAIRLRPSDVDSIIKWTMVWCLEKGRDTKRTGELIDDLADGMRVTISYLIRLSAVHGACAVV